MCDRCFVYVVVCATIVRARTPFRSIFENNIFLQHKRESMVKEVSTQQFYWSQSFALREFAISFYRNEIAIWIRWELHLCKAHICIRSVCQIWYRTMDKQAVAITQLNSMTTDNKSIWIHTRFISNERNGKSNADETIYSLIKYVKWRTQFNPFNNRDLRSSDIEINRTNRTNRMCHAISQIEFVVNQVVFHSC